MQHDETLLIFNKSMVYDYDKMLLSIYALGKQRGYDEGYEEGYFQSTLDSTWKRLKAAAYHISQAIAMSIRGRIIKDST